MRYKKKINKVGKTLIIKPDEDSFGSDYNELSGTITRVCYADSNDDIYLVHLNNAPIIQNEFIVNDLLVGGIDMNLADELFGGPKRPKGLPILVYMYRIMNTHILPDKILHWPAATEFLGRGEIRLAQA